ncbi:DNA polymerase [Polyangium sp. 15x6]|uniref:DNA polymerase n=1 Tax=Polyangium sp. 15x6 TaxID=3042687 RepID=UPI00249C6C69|nr:DNA polymerase [Polyangium sp. 15x6]MDI3284718.1 DNA polymerase [Polyangium sp. 15x6]
MGADLRSVTPEEGAKLLGFPQPLSSGGLYIPYPNAQGYGRIRLDSGDTRFRVPAQREVPVYLPPGFQTKGPQPVYVVEGPIKALSLLDYHFNALGLGGTGTTLEKNARRLNDSWAELDLLGRYVFILFDSNRMTNPNVARDEARLAQALADAGATVRVAALPLKPNGKDQGPDDFLTARGRADLQAIIDAAVPANPVERVEYISKHFPTKEERVRAAAALLNDMPFLASIRERGVGVEKEVLQHLNRLKVTASDLRRAMKQMEDKAKRKAASTPEVVSICEKYDVHNGQLCLVHRIGGAVTHEPICNFTASIVHEEMLDDDVEQQRRFTVTGTLVTGEQFPAVHISPSEFASEDWPLKKWGARAVVFALPRAAGHLRAAIQENSTPASSTTYTHTGLRKHNGEWIYLHTGGAIGAVDVAVDINDNFHRYKLPGLAEDVADAVRLSLDFIDVADPRITAPLHAAVYRALLQGVAYCDAAVAQYGPSGSLKSSVVAVAQSHYGFFDHKTLPLSWTSTANAIEAHLFTMKDMLVVIDDYVPKSADPGDEFHKKAAQVFRSIGNGSARQRLSRDLYLHRSRPPRALVLTTGEQLPEGGSIRARLITIRMRREDVDLDKLKRLQLARGRLPHALRAYIEWLLPRLNSIHTEVATIHEKYAAAFRQQDDVHLRAPEAMAHLLVGAHYFAEFAVDMGVLDAAGAAAYLEKVKAALVANGRDQAHLATETKPSQRFLSVLKSLLTQGRVGLVAAHLPLVKNEPSGAVPTSCEVGGGKNIGWVDDKFVYLVPEAAYESFVQALRAMNEPMPLDQPAFWAQLVEEGLTSKGDGKNLHPKRRVGGVRARVVKLPKHYLLEPSEIEGRVNEELSNRSDDTDDDDPDGGPGGGPGPGGGAGPASGSGQPPAGRGGDAGAPALYPVSPRLPPRALLALPRPYRGPTNGLSVSSTDPGSSEKWPYWPYSSDGSSQQGGVSMQVGEAPTLPSDSHSGVTPAPGKVGPVGPHDLSARSAKGILAQPGRATSAHGSGQPTGLALDVAAFAGDAACAGRVGMAMRSTGARPIIDRPSLLALATPDGKTCVLDLSKPGTLGPLADVLPQVTVVGHDMKAPLMHLAHHLGVEPKAAFDTMLLWKLRDLGEHIDNPKHFNLERARAEAGLSPNDNARAGTGVQREHEAAVAEAQDVLRIADCLREEITRYGMEGAAELELSFQPHIAQTELAGVPINPVEWAGVVDAWGAEAELIKKRFRARGVNIHNDKEVKALLRDEGISVPRTGGGALAPFAHVPLVQDLLRFRTLHSFVAGPGKEVLLRLDKNGRVHASFNQLGAATGRMSCSLPNLLALPRDNKIRGCIQAPPGKKLVVGDYNAIELRVLADFTGDERLVELFQRGRDPHTETAMYILGVSPDAVTKEARDRAKAINFGLMNGMGAASLVAYALENFGVVMSLEEAEEYKRKYFELYVGVLSWHEYVRQEKPDALRTASGRIRYFGEPNQFNAKLCTPIQGTAADGMKQAMVLLAPHLNGLGAQMFLVVHDELLVEAPEEHAEEVKVLMRDCMIAGMQKYVPSVPIVVEPKIMPRWSK